jgi:hypothetical protein
MRASVLLAAAFVGVSIAYKTFYKKQSPTPKTIVSWGVVLVTLSIVGNTQFAQFSDMIAYLIVLIIVLNDGYDLATTLTSK